MKNFILINTANHLFDSNNFYVYEMIDPNTSLPFYVGKGRDDRAWRSISLRSNKKLQKSNPHKFNTINQIINTGGKVSVNIVSTHASEADAFANEQILIKYYGRRCNQTGILCNIAKGGEGYTNEGRSVDQFTLWGEFIRTYNNAKEAARVNKWKHYGVICSSCKGKERSYKGFLWAYTGNTPKLLSTKKPVYQWDMLGNLIAIYESSMAAARAMKCDPSTINDCAQGYNRQALGYMWTKTRESPTLRVHGKRKAVRYINTGEIFDTVTRAAIATGHSVGDISACCRGKKEKIAQDKFAYFTAVAQ